MFLEELLTDFFFRYVRIELISGAVFNGYLIGIKLPVNEIIVLHFVHDRHIDKYIKNGNKRWVEQMPYELIAQVELINEEESETEINLEIFYMKKQEDQIK